MTTIEKIKKLEIELQKANSLLKDNLLTDKSLTNGVVVSISEGGTDVFRGSEYWFGFHSEVEVEIIDLYILGLQNSLKNQINNAKKEVEELQRLINKY